MAPEGRSGVARRSAPPQHPTNNLPWLPPRIASRRCYNDFPIIGAGRGARWSELGGHHGRGRGGRRRYRRAWHLAISRPQGLLAAASPPALPPVQHAGSGPRHQPAACATISPPRHLSQLSLELLASTAAPVKAGAKHMLDETAPYSECKVILSICTSYRAQSQLSLTPREPGLSWP